MATKDNTNQTIHPDLDLFFERTIDLPVDLVWDMWTKPEHLIHWFTPSPWKTVDCRIDLRPGGEFFTMMLSPEGNFVPNHGCYLEVHKNERLVFTDTLLAGFRPSGNSFMTAFLTFQQKGNSTVYKAVIKHKDTETKKQHEDMGFLTGWNSAVDQLIAHARGLTKN